jgi:hypothetical protein
LGERNREESNNHPHVPDTSSEWYAEYNILLQDIFEDFSFLVRQGFEFRDLYL